MKPEWIVEFHRGDNGAPVELVAYKPVASSDGTPDLVKIGLSLEELDKLLTQGRVVMANVLYPPYKSPVDQGIEELLSGS